MADIQDFVLDYQDIVFDGTCGNSASASSTNADLTHSGSSQVIIFISYIGQNSPTSVTVGGVAATYLADSKVIQSGATWYTGQEAWTLWRDSPATENIIVTFGSSTRHAWNAVAYTGVVPNYFQSLRTHHDSQSSVALTSVSVVAGVTGRLIVSGVGAAAKELGTGTITIDAASGETERGEQDLAGGASTRSISNQVQDMSVSRADTMETYCTKASTDIYWTSILLVLVPEGMGVSPSPTLSPSASRSASRSLSISPSPSLSRSASFSVSPSYSPSPAPFVKLGIHPRDDDAYYLQTNYNTESLQIMATTNAGTDGYTICTNAERGIVRTSLADLESAAAWAVANSRPFDCLHYDLEITLSPEEEYADPLASLQAAKAIATSYGVPLYFGPTIAMMLEYVDLIGAFAAIADGWWLQAQAYFWGRTADYIQSNIQYWLDKIYAGHADIVVWCQISFYTPDAPDNSAWLDYYDMVRNMDLDGFFIGCYNNAYLDQYPVEVRQIFETLQSTVSASVPLSASPSVSPSVSKSVSPSASRSVSPSLSRSSSVSPSASRSLSPSSSVSPSISPSPSTAIGIDDIVLEWQSASASPSLSPSLSPSTVQSVLVEDFVIDFVASISQSPSLSPSPSVSPSGAAFSFDSSSGTCTALAPSLSWEHTPIGDPNGVVVYAVVDVSGTATAVADYGGVAMTQVQLSPNHKLTGESGSVFAFHLGAGIPTGPQIVTVTFSDLSRDSFRACAECFTTVGSYPTIVISVNNSIIGDVRTDPQQPVLKYGFECFVSQGFFSGQGSVASISPLVDWEETSENDFGTSVCGFYRYKLIDKTDNYCGWYQSAEDAICLAVAIAEWVQSASISPSASYSPSASESPSVSQSRSISPSRSLSQSMSASPSASRSMSISQSASHSASRSVSPSLSPSIPPCYIAITTVANVTADYYVRIKNTDGTTVAVLDDWISLDYEKEINSLYSFNIQLYSGDPRFDLIGLDYFVEVWRRISGAGVNWYIDFVGLARKKNRKIGEDGVESLVVAGVGLNHLLSRRIIAYREGTIYSDKEAPAETVMKEYVKENCGSTAITTGYDDDPADPGHLGGGYPRLRPGTIPNFFVEPDSGYGDTWSGVKGLTPLFDTLQEIADFAEIDFQVEEYGTNGFEFKTYEDQIGEDRTSENITSADGRNSAGNLPVVFSPDGGTVRSIEYDLDRTAEKNVCFVTGSSEKSTLHIHVRTNGTTIADSPWNTCEFSTNASENEFDYQMEDAGDAALKENMYKEVIEFAPIEQLSRMYGLHYFFGDRVTVSYAGIVRHKRIISVKISIKAGAQTVAITVKDLPPA